MKNEETGRIARLLLHSSFFILPSLAAIAAEDEIPKLAPPLPELPPTFWEQHGTTLLLASLAALLLVALLVWRLLRPRPAVVIPPEVQARQALKALCSRPEDGAVLSEVSQVLHRYFRTAFALAPGELTTAEFCQTLAAHETIGPQLAAAVAKFLRRCDQQKFSPAASGDETTADSLSTHKRGDGRDENSPDPNSRLDPPNRSAAVSETSRSSLNMAAAGFQHSRAPVQGEETNYPSLHNPSPQPSPRLGGERESAAVATALELIAQAEVRRAELRAAATPPLPRA